MQERGRSEEPVPRRPAAVPEEYHGAHGETVTLTVPLMPLASKMLADRIPKSQMKILDGVSHGFFWERPEMAAETLEGWFRSH